MANNSDHAIVDWIYNRLDSMDEDVFFDEETLKRAIEGIDENTEKYIKANEADWMDKVSTRANSSRKSFQMGLDEYTRDVLEDVSSQIDKAETQEDIDKFGTRRQLEEQYGKERIDEIRQELADKANELQSEEEEAETRLVADIENAKSDERLAELIVRATQETKTRPSERRVLDLIEQRRGELEE